jgi:hypothetical protein
MNPPFIQVSPELLDQKQTNKTVPGISIIEKMKRRKLMF